MCLLSPKTTGSIKQPKQTRFAPDHETIGTTAVNKSMWYHRAEIALFKLDAKDYITGRLNQHNNTTRGLERYDQERIQNKVLAINCTLHAIRMGMDPQKVANVATKLSTWSTDQAFQIGCQDYCEVYYPHMAGVMSNLLQQAAKPTHQAPTKRLSEVTDEGRRVRMRVS